MWPFKQKTLLDPEEIDWLVENFSWLVECWAQGQALTNATLVLPQPGFFETGNKVGHALAVSILDQIKTYAQISDWPTELVKGEPLPSASRSMFEVQHPASPLGTFQTMTDGPVRICYASNLMQDPQGLVATLAHEIAHYVLAGAPAVPVCEPDQHEFLTDLTAVYLGFGVFLANNAFDFSQFRDDGSGTQGWQAQRRGYLSENQLVTALALFLMVRKQDFDPALKCLKPHLAKALKHAAKDLEGWRSEIEAIAKLESDPVR